MQNPNEKSATSDRINDFVQKHRKPIFVSAGAVVVLLAACIAGFSLTDVLRNRAITAVEDLNSRYEELRPTITEDDSENDVALLLEDLAVFAKKNSGYAGGRAWYIAGSIHSDRKNWEEAEAAWAAAAKAAKKTYMVPFAFFNAGVAAEEQGKIEEAIGYYASSLSAPADFPFAPRAQFSIGRLRESLNETEAAIGAYRSVISRWPYDEVWTNLARSRVIALEARKEAAQ